MKRQYRRFKNVKDSFNWRTNKTAGCWIWQGVHVGGGYGFLSMNINGKPSGKLAHRLSYELHIGEIPEGYEIDHLCKVRDCVRPEHLEAVTRQENINRSNIGKAQRAMTECKHGHPFDEENTYWYRGLRGCKICRRNNLRKSRKRRKNLKPS